MALQLDIILPNLPMVQSKSIRNFVRKYSPAQYFERVLINHPWAVDGLMNRCMFGLTVTRDTDVDVRSNALKGKSVLLAITGGIAAVESVKLARELRRHQAELTVVMSKEATKVITPLAVSWASGVKVMEGWSSEMAQLDRHDVVLVAPATRNTISKHIHGIMDSELMMALSAARGRGDKMCFIPSMHQDLFDDPVTSDLISTLQDQGALVITSDSVEGKIKQPDPVYIVAMVCHLANLSSRSKTIAITLGANRAPIDDVRAIQNASSGRTGWLIAEYLHRFGHRVICVAGKTSSPPSFNLPLVFRDGTPDGMLSLCKKVAIEYSPDVWIHAAAVLDYYTEPEIGKRASGSEEWSLNLKPGPKHIAELSNLSSNSIRIGFKLESGVDPELLIERARLQLEKYQIDAVVANLMQEMNDPNSIRARIVAADGSIEVAPNDLALCESIARIISAK